MASLQGAGGPQAAMLTQLIGPLLAQTFGYKASPSTNDVNEILLVCGVIGSTVDHNFNKIVHVIDCLNWLQDLQRAL